MSHPAKFLLTQDEVTNTQSYKEWKSERPLFSPLVLTLYGDNHCGCVSISNGFVLSLFPLSFKLLQLIAKSQLTSLSGVAQKNYFNILDKIVQKGKMVTDIFNNLNLNEKFSARR